MAREGRELAWVVLGATAVAIAACVLVEPPQELPIPLPRRPLILHTSLQPPQDKPLTNATSLPSLVAFVDAEPSKAINYRVWVDFGSTDSPLALNNTNVPAAPSAANRRIEFAVSYAELGDARFCHSIKLVVAYEFFPVSNTPTTEGDEVTWTYRPGGDTGGCISLDGGIPDAGVLDASDGASE